jgi:hypothetical protein
VAGNQYALRALQEQGRDLGKTVGRYTNWSWGAFEPREQCFCPAAESTADLENGSAVCVKGKLYGVSTDLIADCVQRITVGKISDPGHEPFRAEQGLLRGPLAAQDCGIVLGSQRGNLVARQTARIDCFLQTQNVAGIEHGQRFSDPIQRFTPRVAARS